MDMKKDIISMFMICIKRLILNKEMKMMKKKIIKKKEKN